MKQRTKTVIATASAVLAVSAVVGGSVWFSSAVAPTPEPKQTYRLYEPAPETTEREATPTPTVTPTEAVTEDVAPQAPVEQAPAAPVEQAPAPQPEAPAPEPQQPDPQPQAPDPAPAPQPEPEPAPVPILCPGGSTSTDSDGFNDLGCLPDICFSITLPDATHPECDTPFRP